MDFGLLVFFLIIALVVRSLVKSVNTLNSSKSAARRQQFQELARRMRSTARRSRPGFPQPPNATYGQEVGGPGYQQPRGATPGSTAPFSQPTTAQTPPTAPIAPPTPAFTARWPSGAPMDAPQLPRFDPVVVEVAVDPAPESAYPTDEPTSADVAPDTTAPVRRPYELSSSLDTTLSTSLTSSIIGEPGSITAGPQTVALPPDVHQQVLGLMAQGQEVAAVRLVCDLMKVGILDAQKTVRSAVGLPSVM